MGWTDFHSSQHAEDQPAQIIQGSGHCFLFIMAQSPRKTFEGATSGSVMLPVLSCSLLTEALHVAVAWWERNDPGQLSSSGICLAVRPSYLSALEQQACRRRRRGIRWLDLATHPQREVATWSALGSGTSAGVQLFAANPGSPAL